MSESLDGPSQDGEAGAEISLVRSQTCVHVMTEHETEIIMRKVELKSIPKTLRLKVSE